ncbi:tetratricopeptide repeat protein [Haemophilus sputorum]|uniref:Sel1 repeat family protein n=1 Tax=Haemophilus sputorum TaxID=1078480 RepID=A0ABX9HWZ3_9PAST|nr:tetratricopeptide repeat protein [Haemophilus sputorum]RDF09695.1 sel1 repeat family protein [Haemophilus sputorum]RDF12854.1 sel1 repeat family protein [Haemophilus sputorum]
MINIIATLIAAAALNSPSQLPQEQTTSSTQEAVVADIASMTPEQRLEKAKALYEKGFDYEYGITKTVDRTLADKFLKEAANLGHADALFFLGMNAVDNGDLEQARAYADSAIELGNMAGKYILAEISEQEYLGDSEELYKAGFKVIKEKVEQGDLHYSNVLGYAYRFGIGTEENIKQAIKVFTPSAEQGNAMSLGHLGEIYFEQGKVEDAKKFTLKSAEKNNSKAQLNLSFIDDDTEKSLYWLNRAAENNEISAIMNLAYYYHDKDIKKAASYYQKAADLDDDQAVVELSYLYENGEGVEKNDEKAVELLDKAVGLENFEAMNKLSIRYLEGRGVERNYEMAEALFNNIIALDESLSEKEKASYNVYYQLAERYEEFAKDDNATLKAYKQGYDIEKKETKRDNKKIKAKIKALETKLNRKK